MGKLLDETNIKTGTDAENFVAHELAKLGMWAGQFPPAISGKQPFDIIAISKNNTYCIDVKHCKDNYFPFDRVEENQKLSLSYLDNEVGNLYNSNGFVLVYENTPYWLPYGKYERLSFKGDKSVKPQDLMLLSEYIEMIENG